MLLSHSATNNIFLADLDVELYNRHGQLIYRGKSWDGTSDGKPVKQGVYFYKVRYLRNEEWVEATGYIAIQ